MTVTTLRPTSIGNDTSVAGVGAGTHLARISDNSDTTSIRLTSGSLQGFDVQFSGYSTPAGSYIRRVRAGVRIARVTGGIYGFANGFLNPGTISAITGNEFQMTLTNAISTVQQFYTGWSTTTGYGPNDPFYPQKAWTDALVNAEGLSVIASTPAYNSDDLDIYDIWLEVETNVIPTATVTAPTGSITDRTRPTITFTYNDSDGDAMDLYHYKIFTAAQYGAGGFDPATSAAFYDSGELSQTLAAGGSLSLTSPVDLTNGTTYKVYCMVRQVTDSKYATAWAVGPSFTISIDAPAQPTITATAVATAPNNRVDVVVQARDNELSKNNASFETSVAGYAATNAALAQSSTQFLNGAFSMRMTASSAADMSALSATGTSGIPVVAGATYEALASFRAGTTGRSVHVDILWYTAAGAAISTSTGASVSDTNAGWTQAVVNAVAPPTASFAAVRVFVISPANTEIHYVDQVSLAPGSSTTWTRGGLVDANQTITIQRSLDAGTTWATVRSGVKIDPAVGQAYTISDYETAPGVTASYRAFVQGTDAGFILAGPYSATATATVTPVTTTGWILKVPESPANNLEIDIFSSTWDEVTDEEQAVYHALGRQYPLIVSDVIHGRDGTLEIEFTTSANRDAFRALRALQKTCLLQRYYGSVGEQKYIRLGKTLKVVEQNTTPVIYRLTIDYLEVDVP